MALNWINVREFSFNCMTLLERFQILYMCGIDDGKWLESFGIALRRNPTVAWYLQNRCPERAARIREIIENAPPADDARGKEAEYEVMSYIEDFILYTQPDLMDSHCDFIYAWDKRRLFEMTDFTGKRVLDVGSGSGRLAFAAAELAAEVYALEPVETLRTYLEKRIERDGIKNIRVVSGLVTSIPYPDDTFDIVMSGHVVGDETERELAELERVTKNGGYLLDCPGEERRKFDSERGLLQYGFEELYYKSSLGGDVRRYKKQIIK